MEKYFFEKIVLNQKNHWWYKSRREIFFKILKKLNLKNQKILDYGSGAGANIHILKKLSQNIDVFEPNKKMHPELKDRGVNVITKLEGNYDLILLTDVIEHIKHDKEEMLYLANNLNTGGYMFITVPAYQFLYSSKDLQLKHFRRYNKDSLIKIIPKNLNIIKISYMNFFLFLPLTLIIMFNKFFNKKFSKLSEEIPNKLINLLLYKIFSFEKYFIDRINFPFGVSILALVKKK